MQEYKVIVLAEKNRLPHEEQIVKRIAEEGFEVKLVRGEDDLRQELDCGSSAFPIIVAEVLTLGGRVPPEGTFLKDTICGPLLFLILDSCGELHDGFELLLVGERKYMQANPYRHETHLTDCWMSFPIDPDQLAFWLIRIRRSVENAERYELS